MRLPKLTVKSITAVGILITIFTFSPNTFTTAQVNFTANDKVQPYNGIFRAGVNFDVYRGFTDEDLGLLAAGDAERGIQGAGIKAVRPGFFEDFAEHFGYESRVGTFKYYESLGLIDNTMIVGFPSDAHREDVFYCEGYRSTVFKNMYTPIWDNGENGTPVNDTNYYALYIWKTVNLYKNHIKFWEVWNEPGFDFTGGKGWLPKGAPGSWWENNPQPCEYKLRAPIFSYNRLLRITYEVVKSIDPNAYVVTSGVGFPSFLDALLRNTDNPDGGKVTPQYPLKGGAYFDGIGYHAYPHFDDALRAYNDTRLDWDYFRHSDAAAADPARIKNMFQEVLTNYGYNGKMFPNKIWLITESNLPRKEFGEFIGSAESQKNFMPKAYINCVKNDILQFHVFKIAEETDFDKATYEFDVMGLYKKLHYSNKTQPEMTDQGISYRTTSQILFGLAYDSIKTKNMSMPEGVEGAAFKDANGIYTYVIWAKTTKDKSEIASAIYSFPMSFNLKNLVKRDWDFSKTKVQTPISSSTFTLSATPIFLTESLIGAVEIESCSNSVTLEDFSTSSSRIWSIKTSNSTTITRAEKKTTVNFAGKGIYTAQLTAFDANNTEIGKQVFTIKINEKPTADFTFQVENPFVKLFNKSSSNTNEIRWSFSDGTSSILPDLTKVFYTSGNFVITLSAKNACGETTKMQQVTIKAPTAPQVKTAQEETPQYSDPFRAGVNMRFTQGWTDEQVADIAAGNKEMNLEGIGAKSLRTMLPEYFTQFWGTDIRAKTFEHFGNLDLKNNILTIGFPDDSHRDTNYYCYNQRSFLFKNMYLDIWDAGEGNTPVNDSNYFARYVYDLVKIYKNQVKFWEVWDTPGWDFEAKNGWKPRNWQHNWWENNPDPCELGIHAPVQHIVRMMRIAYEVIKKEDPTAFVVLSGSGFPSFIDAIARNTDNPTDGKPTPQYPNGGGAYFDALLYNVFPHVDGSLSKYDPAQGKIVFTRNTDAAVQSIVNQKVILDSVLQVYGFNGIKYPNKRYIIGETNIPRKSFNESFGGEEEQKNYILKAYVTAAMNGILAMTVKNISEDSEMSQATDAGQVMGLYQKLPSRPYMTTKNVQGIAFKSISEILQGAVFDSLKTKALNLPKKIKGAAFKNGKGKYTFVLWAEATKDKMEWEKDSFSLPTALNINNLYKREWSFSEDEKVILISSKNIPLSTTPIFLTEEEMILPTPIGLFTSNFQKACPPFDVQFEDKSANATSVLWRFEGGTPATSTERNPKIKYNQIGKFNVSLEVKNANGTHIYTKSHYITTSEKPKAEFNYTLDSGVVVRFNNKTAGTFTMIWDFGDGSPLNYTFEPTHRYAVKKPYTIRMIAINDCGRDTIFKTIDLLTSTEEREFVQKLNLTCYPNPFQNDLSVKFNLSESTPINLSIYDIQGRKIAELIENQYYTEGVHALNLDPKINKSGTYILRIQTKNGTAFRKILKFD